MARIVWVSVLVLVFVLAGFSQSARERKNIDQMSPHELAVYKHALRLIMKNPDPKVGYEYHANLHNLFEPNHGCEHRNDLFFPWHRYHLLNFEKALRATDPDNPTLSTKDITIPYWNWTQQASGARYPKAFENEIDPDGQRNPLYHENRETDPLPPAFSEQYMSGVVRDNSDWNMFAGGAKSNASYGALEQPAHNDMHGSYIGGTMGDPTEAAMDPIYWSYHAFIDMQWDRWQKIHKKPPTSLDSVLRGFTGSPKVRDVEDVSAEYFYTHSPASVTPVTETMPGGIKSSSHKLMSVISGADKLVAVWGGEGPFLFKVPTSTSFRRADLWFDDIVVPDTFSYRAEIFLHPSDRLFKASDTAGFISVWKGHAAGDMQGHDNTAKLFLNVTAKLKSVVQSNPGKNITVTVVPRPISPALGFKTAKPAVPTPQPDITFKRLFLVLDSQRLPNFAKESHDH